MGKYAKKGMQWFSFNFFSVSYLFWSADNHPKPKVGLYRLDLANISNGIKHDVNPKLLLQEKNLGAFTVDYAKYRLIVASEGKNTVNSVSFDG